MGDLNIVHRLLSEIALAGDTGIEAGQLFDGFPSLPAVVRKSAWCALLRYRGDIRFVLKGSEGGSSVGSEGGSALGRGGRGGGDETMSHGDADSVVDYDKAVHSGVVLKASGELKDAIIGVYGNDLLRFSFSDIQKKSLLLLTKAGLDGIPQNVLSSMLGIGNNNSHYLVKALMERDLIVRKKANIRMMKEGSSGVVTNVTTHILYLSKYADIVDQMPRTDVGTTNDSENIVSTRYINDRVIFQKIIEQLKRIDEHVAIEADLKVALGFRQVQGHRLWRRIKESMQQMGLIEVFQGITDNNKTESFVRLVQTLDDLEQKSVESGPGPNTVVIKPHRSLGAQVVELSLDRQILLAIAKAGAEGMTTSALDSLLSINLKRNSVRISEMVDRYGNAPAHLSLRVDTVNCQRSIVKRFTASTALSAMLLRVHHCMLTEDEPPQTPIGGWLQAVKRASMNMLTEKEIEVLEARSVLKTEGSNDPENLANDESGALIGVEKAKNKPEFGRLVTEIGKLRKKWFVDKVNEIGMLLGSEVSRVLYEAQVEAGDPGSRLIDKKMYMRIAHAAEKEKLVDIVEIMVPNQTGSTGIQKQFVFLPHGTEFTNKLFDTAVERYQKTFKSKPLQELNKKRPKVLPRISGKIRESSGIQQKSKSTETFQKQLENGYRAARLYRYEIIFNAVWRLVERQMTSDSPSMIQDDVDKIVKSGQQVILRDYQEGTAQRASLVNIAEQDSHLIFSLRQLRDEITVDEFAKALGSVCKDARILESLQEKKLGELKTASQVEVAGGVNQLQVAVGRRLSLILASLQSLGLIKGLFPVGSNSFHRQSNIDGFNATLFMVSTKAMHESIFKRTDSSNKDVYEYIKRRHDFDLANPKERKGYWVSLQLFFSIFYRYLEEERKSAAESRLPKCFPYAVAQDAVSDKFYDCEASELETATKHLVSEYNEQWLEKLTWETVDKIASSLFVSHPAIIRALSRLMARKGSKRLDSLVLKLKKPAKKEVMKTTLEAPEDDAMEEEEDLEPLLLQPEPPEAPIRKRTWRESEDRQLLQVWVRFIAENGPSKLLLWKNVKGRPSGLKPVSCKNRINKLNSDPQVMDHMEIIKREAIAVFERHSQRTGGNISKKSKGAKKPKRSLGSDFFDAVLFEEDLESRQVIANAIERVVQAAPMRHTGEFDGASVLYDKSRYANKGLREGWVPVDVFLWLRACARRAQAAFESGQMPSVEVTAAMSSILSCLVACEFNGITEELAQSFLSCRFNVDVLKAALKILVQTDLIYYEFKRENDGHSLDIGFNLSDRAKSEMKHPFSPPLFWQQAHTFIQADTWWPRKEESDAGVLPLLSAITMGKAQYRIKILRNISLDKEWLHENVTDVFLSARQELIGACSPERLESKMVGYQPSVVYQDAKRFNAAREAFIKDARNAVSSKVARSVLDLLRNAGLQGLSSSALQKFLDINKINIKSTVLEDLLCQHGIARKIEGFDESFLLPSEISSHLAIQKGDSEYTRGDSMEPLQEVPLRLWVDPNGKLLPVIWHALVQRVLDIVCRFPGIDGNMVLQTLRVVPPRHAQELVKILCASKVLYFEYRPKESASRASLATWLGLQKQETTEKQNELQNYVEPFQSGSPEEYMFFVDPMKSLGSWNVKPPYVLA